jgi:PAS domain S-box-containing protein/putative nucleotidyltransferase with HDIG domain
MLEGLAHCRMLFDKAGRPVDWVYLDVNPAFERLTGLRGVVGKKVSQVLPRTREDNPELLEIYGRVATTGVAEEFEIDFKPLGMWLNVSVFSPAKGYFVALFDDITQRKRAELEAALLSSAIQNASVSVMIVDEGAQIMRVNRRACETLGLSAKALVSMTLADIDPAFGIDRWPAYLETLRKHGPQRVIREVRTGADGGMAPLELHLSLVRVGDHEVVVAFAHDISDRLAAEVALRERERVLSTLMSNLPGMAYRCANDAKWTMEFVSAGCEELTGCAPAELVGNATVAYADVIAETHREMVAQEVAGGVAPDQRWTLTYPIITATGQEKWVWERGVAVRDAQGEVQALEGLITDVTAQHEAEERLALAASEWRQTFDAMTDCVAVLDEKGRVLRCNAATSEFTGLGFGDIVGRPCYEVFHGAAAPHPDCPHARSRASGRAESSTFEQGGHWLRVTCQPVVDAQSCIFGAVHVVTDVTEMKRTEQRLVESVAKQRVITDGVIAALARAIDVRDPYTAGHERRVSELAAAMARQLGFGEDRCEGVRVAGMLHDVGKIIIPAEILSKPGRLSETEFRLIQAHARASFDILESIDFPWQIAEMALQHHERLDGSGYPRGLRGEQLLPEACVLAVADVVEAMSSHRPYRAALGIEAALGEITSGAGRLYDANAVAACVELLANGRFSFSSETDIP